MKIPSDLGGIIKLGNNNQPSPQSIWQDGSEIDHPIFLKK